jgi:hypothetical protein
MQVAAFLADNDLLFFLFLHTLFHGIHQISKLKSAHYPFNILESCHA